MVEILARKNTETSLGKAVIEHIETINAVVEQILKDNLDLRHIKRRHIVKLIAEDKLKRKIADESVPRSCRFIQNTKKLWLPEKDDGRFELAEEHRGYYSKVNKSYEKWEKQGEEDVKNQP